MKDNTRGDNEQQLEAPAERGWRPTLMVLGFEPNYSREELERPQQGRRLMLGISCTTKVHPHHTKVRAKDSYLTRIASVGKR